ncbi:MAG: 4Fe-4S binding protein [bacterium]
MRYEIHTVEDRCKGCLICIEICQADVLAVSDSANRYGKSYPLVVKQEACIGCGMCEMFCPDFAIWVTSEEVEAVR